MPTRSRPKAPSSQTAIAEALVNKGILGTARLDQVLADLTTSEAMSFFAAAAFNHMTQRTAYAALKFSIGKLEILSDDEVQDLLGFGVIARDSKDRLYMHPRVRHYLRIRAVLFLVQKETAGWRKGEGLDNKQFFELPKKE